jgi:hypothetical protein
MDSKKQPKTNLQTQNTQSEKTAISDISDAPPIKDELEQELEQKILAQTKNKTGFSLEEEVFVVPPTPTDTKIAAPQNKTQVAQQDTDDIQSEMERRQEQTLAELEATINDTANTPSPAIPLNIGETPKSAPPQPTQKSEVPEEKNLAPLATVPQPKTPPMKTPAIPAEQPATLKPITSETKSSTQSADKQTEESQEGIPQVAQPLVENSTVSSMPTNPSSDFPAQEKQPKGIQKIRSRFTDSLVRPLRTYRDDVARAIQQKNASMVSVISAEADRRSRTMPILAGQEAARNTSPKFFVFVALGALLVGVGAATLAWTLLIYPTQKSPIPASSIPSFIFVEEQRPLDITNHSSSQISDLLYAARDATELSLGGIAQLYFVEKKETNSPEAPLRIELVPAMRLFDLWGMRIPASLVRSIDEHLMFGFHAFDGNQPFFIFKTALYENAFAGMLDWERTIKNDMGLVFKFPVAVSTTTATSTTENATTTPTGEDGIATSTTDNLDSLIRTNRPFVEPFRDRVVRNKEVRVLEDENGKILLLYAFQDRQTIIITTNEFTLNEVVSRLNSIQF